MDYLQDGERMTEAITILVATGQGNSVYFSEDVLRRDCETVFPAGKKVTDENGVPIGELKDNAYYDADGKQGAGVYGVIMFYGDTHSAFSIVANVALNSNSLGVSRLTSTDSENAT